LITPKDSLRLVWVEIGRRIPGYLTRSIKIHRKLYPDAELILVTDQDYANNYLTRAVSISELPKTYLHNEFDLIEKKSHSHQKDFWVNTTKRFYVLYDFLSLAGFSSIIHIESDVILLEKDSAIKVSEVAKKEDRIAYPIYDEKSGSPGVVFVPRAEILGSALKFFLEYWSSSDMTDMKLFSLYSFQSVILENGINKSEPTLDVSTLGIWDGGRLGQFFLGTDARNSRLPFSIRYKKEFIYDEAEEAQLQKVIRDMSKGIPRIRKLGNFGLASIHIHNKLLPSTIYGLNLQLFTSVRFVKFGRLITGYRLDFVVLLERLVGYFKRRALGNSAEVNFR
jgi:hypothetical protein